jgi:hypothetical protein
MGATQRPFDESYNVDKNEELLQGVIKNNEWPESTFRIDE